MHNTDISVYQHRHEFHNVDAGNMRRVLIIISITFTMCIRRILESGRAG